MQHLNEEEVKQRASDVFLNLFVIDNEARIGLPSISAESTEWMIRWTHVLEELEIRFGPYPAGFSSGFLQSSSVPLPSNPLAEKAAAAVSERKVGQKNYLVKYGKLAHLRDAYDSGRMRIAPASMYSDASLNHAIRDTELEVELQPSPTEFRIQVVDQDTGEIKGEVFPIGNKIVKVSRTNYYVGCFSTTFSPRLFLDFDDADACLLIVRPVEFTQKIFSAFEKQLPDFAGICASVRYFDPLNSGLDGLDVCFSKHFRYAYQQEFRFVWLPPENLVELESLYLDLGPLSDCAELVVLADARL